IMKKMLRSSKITSFLWVIFLVGLGASCQDKKDVSENKESYEGSNSCELITAENIRSIFNLGEDVEIKQTEKFRKVCYYTWQSQNEEKLHYSVRFAFARWAQKSATEIERTWANQNEAVYKEHNLQKVPGVGDKAS